MTVLTDIASVEICIITFIQCYNIIRNGLKNNHILAGVQLSTNEMDINAV